MTDIAFYMQLKSAVPSAADRCCAENEKLFFAEKGEWGTPLEKGKCLYFSKVHKNMYIQRIEKLRSQRMEIVENVFFSKRNFL